MNYCTLQDLLKELKDIQEKGPYIEKEGICENINSRTFCFYSEKLKKYFLIWPHFSGNSAFPVPSDLPLDSSPSRRYSNARRFSNGMWDMSTSQYACYRWDLLDHLIQCVEKELSNAN